MKVSIIMSAYKEPVNLIKCAVESIENQTFRDFEFIIILDNPDNITLLKYLKELEQHYGNIHVEANDTNIGLALSLNKGLKLARGEYIARMDADDYSFPRRLQKEVNYLDSHPEVSVVATNRYNMDESGEIISEATPVPKDFKSLCKQMKYENVVLHPSVMFRKADIDKLGGYRNFPASQDIDLWLRVIDAGMLIAHIDEPLLKYRISTTSITGSVPFKQWLCNRYIRFLQEERLRTGTDSYSYENLMRYLDAHGYGDNANMDAFKKGMSYFREGRRCLKAHKFMKAIAFVIKALFAHNEMPAVIWASIQYQRLAHT